MLEKHLRQTPHHFDKGLAKSCAELYCRIWKEPPWNEDFWRPEDVMINFRKDLAMPEASCWFSTNDSDGLLGFSWGYEVDSKGLNKVVGDDRLEYLFEHDSKLFYVSELGVDADKRQKGVGKRLTQLLLSDALAAGFRYTILRTDLRATPARTLYSHLGFQELPILDSRHASRSYWLLQM
jgi:ribosomal protein S18 acetylase RimI-like enzyme